MGLVAAASAVRQKTGAADPAEPCYDNGALSVGTFYAPASVESMIGTYAYTPDIWPPLATIALVLQDEYKIVIDEDDYPRLKTVQLICADIEEKLAAKQ